MLESVGVDILGKTPLECWWAMEPNAEQFTRILQQVVETGNPETTLIQAETRAGKIIYWTMKLVPEFDQEGVVTGVLSCATDITELKEYQRQVEASQMQLRALAIRSEKLREDERKRLARDLHDDLGQRLTALKLDLARLTLRFGQSNPELQKQVQEMELDMGATILIVRDVATQLRPSALEMGIVSGLEWLILEFRKRSNIKCQLRIPKHKLALDDHQDTALFHIVQESLTNIMRHAMATEVKIILSCDVQYYVLEISDNGVGFDAKKRKTGSFGLIGIEERALSLGGDMHIETALNQGLKLTIRIPVFHAIGEKL
jgi:signal transduction histidine kinase